MPPLKRQFETMGLVGRQESMRKLDCILAEKTITAKNKFSIGPSTPILERLGPSMKQQMGQAL